MNPNSQIWAILFLYNPFDLHHLQHVACQLWSVKSYVYPWKHYLHMYCANDSYGCGFAVICEIGESLFIVIYKIIKIYIKFIYFIYNFWQVYR